MKHQAWTLALTLLSANAFAQDAGKSYQSSGFEISFTTPLLDYNGTDAGGVMRFAPVVQAQHVMNYDLGGRFGVFAGASVNNVGFIYDDPDGISRYKFRTYNLGIPMGIKIGHMDHALVFAGYAIEWPMNYKEKKFQYGDKVERFTSWFGSRAENPQQAFILGFQTGSGVCAKVKYYFTNFHDQSFSESEGGAVSTPYAGFNANILYVSIGFALFQDHYTAYRI